MANKVDDFIPLCIPNVGGNEWEYIKDCLDTNWVSSVGSYVNLFEEKMAEYIGTKYAVSTVNGTAALHIALLLAKVGHRDLVIVPNITFAASVNSIVYTHAEPILMDVNPMTWQMDLDLLEEFLNNHTHIDRDGSCRLNSTGQHIKAIMPVHVLGNMCNMERLMAISRKYNLLVIEDASEALGTQYGDKQAGSFGQIGCFSFNGNKIMTTGGGGLIVTNDEALAKMAKHLTTQAKTDPVEYVHDQVGYNYRLVNVLAAMGVAQLEQLPDFLMRKRMVAWRYDKGFETITDIVPQKITPGVKSNHWLYTVKVPNRRKVMAHLRENKVQARPLWTPMHKLPMFANALYVYKKDVSSQIFEQCVSLPCSTNITNKQVDRVIDLVKEACKS